MSKYIKISIELLGGLVWKPLQIERDQVLQFQIMLRKFSEDCKQNKIPVSHGLLSELLKEFLLDEYHSKPDQDLDLQKFGTLYTGTQCVIPLNQDSFLDQL